VKLNVVRLSPRSFVHPSARIESDIPPFTYVGRGVQIGSDCRIGPGTLIGVDGFGYTLEPDGSWQRKDEEYGVVIEDRVDIGAGSIIARGSYRDTVIGKGTKIDAGVFIAHNVLVGRNCLIVAGAEISGSVELGDGVIVGPQVSIKQHLNIDDGAFVGMGAVVVKDIPAGEIWAGNPARYMRDREEGEAT
jgi:UDP-3-O-[3-hydroxymyristoyl] glucosamine N-acyltransferase